jgi:hypothetical protein
MDHNHESFWIQGRPALKIQRGFVDTLKTAFLVLHLFLGGSDE